MAKGKRRSRGDASSSSDDNDHDNVATQQETSKSKATATDFKARRELQRSEAAEKRRSKQRCYLCGQVGHVRRACPGFEDDGRGESKFTKAKGDAAAGATTLKTSNRGKKKGTNQARLDSSTMISGLELPQGFEPIDKTCNSNSDCERDDQLFFYYDAMCDGAATLQYLQTGRTGALFQKTKDEAFQEYRRILTKSTTTSNFGGCIAQVYLKTNQSWTPTTSPPLPWLESDPLPVVFVIGLNPGFDCQKEHQELAHAVLQTACEDTQRVVGLCATLDYSQHVVDDSDKEAQLARVECTCEMAAKANVPVQLKLFPGAVPRKEREKDDDTPYSRLIADLYMLLERHTTLKVHVCSWTGRADDMMGLLKDFPTRVWIGIDGLVSFAKATIAHECAFDVPLDRLLLETGSNNNIPTPVAIALGRQAFSHSGLIPYVAAAVAKYKKYLSSHEIARAASENAIELYGLKG
jgi:hypothetical protein